MGNSADCPHARVDFFGNTVFYLVVAGYVDKGARLPTVHRKPETGLSSISSGFSRTFHQTFHRRRQRGVGRTFYVTLTAT